MSRQTPLLTSGCNSRVGEATEQGGDAWREVAMAMDLVGEDRLGGQQIKQAAQPTREHLLARRPVVSLLSAAQALQQAHLRPFQRHPQLEEEAGRHPAE